MMTGNIEFSDTASDVSAVGDLTADIAEAEAQIADGLKNLTLAKAMLVSVAAEPKTATNKEGLRDSKTAWRASIEAYKATNAYYQSVIDKCKAKIEAILKHTPEARRDN